MSAPRKNPNKKIPAEWIPAIGTPVTAHLPGESVRATVIEHSNANQIIVKLDIQHPLAKSHNYRFNSKVILFREKASPQGFKWVCDPEI